jgi:hypothetical protein
MQLQSAFLLQSWAHAWHLPWAKEEGSRGSAVHSTKEAGEKFHNQV